MSEEIKDEVMENTENGEEKKVGVIKRGISYVGANWKPLGLGFLMGSLTGGLTTAIALSRYDEEDEEEDFEEDQAEEEI